MITTWRTVFRLILTLDLFLYSTSDTDSAYNFLMVLASSKVSMLAIRPDHCPEVFLNRLLVNPPTAILLQSLKSEAPPHEEFPRNDLHVICLHGGKFYVDQLQPLAVSLHNRRNSRTIFYLTNFPTRQSMERLLRHCHYLRMLNVLMFAIDENVYFSYQPYPHFTMRKHSILEYPTFAPSFPNMHGQPLIVMPDQSHPRTIVYRNNRTGALVLTGSVGRFVRTLAWKLNATLQYPVPIVPGRVLHSVELQAIADDMAIDVPAGMVELTDSEQLSRAPYPFELTHICLMIPLANDIPLKDIYLYLNSASNILIALSIIYSYGLVLALHKCHVEQKDARLVDFLLNDAALRGLFGLPFRLANNASACCRLIYVILGVMGLNLNCIYNAHLGTMLTHPPQQPQPRTYTDVRQAGLPLAIHEHDLDIAKDMHLRLLPLNSSELNRLRDNMNTSNVYLCTRIHWSLYSAQQQYFARELFIFSPDACYSQLSLLSFQMPNNSWLVEPMNELIMDVRANGIFQYWLERHFFDMAAAGLVSFKDLSPARNYGGALQLAHLQWIWYAYIILLSIAFCIFVMEIAFNHIRLHRN